MSTPTSTWYPIWPAAGLRAFPLRCMELLDRREAEIPLEQDVMYYVAQSVSGSGAGGGGTGTRPDPFLIRNIADLHTLGNTYAAAGGVTFLIEEYADLRGNSGVVVPYGNVRYGRYGSDGRNPVVSGYTDDDGTGWSNADGMRSKTYATQVNWVRLNQHPSVALEIGNETIFRKTGCNIKSISVHASAPTITTGAVYASTGGGHTAGDLDLATDPTGSYHGLKVGDTVVLKRTNSTPALSGAYTVASVPSAVSFTVAATTTVAGTSGFCMQRTNNCWAYDATATTLYVRIGANVDPALTTIQACMSTGDGFLAGYDGCRIEGLTILGWGMESVASQKYAVRASFATTYAIVVKSCRMYYCGHHIAGNLFSSPGTAGGISTWIDCEMGLARSDSSGEATLLVSYNYGGGNDVIYWNPRGQYGILPDTTQGTIVAGQWDPTYPRGGVLFYAHANGSTEIGFGLAWFPRSDNHALGLYQNSSFGNAPAYTNNRGNLASYRCFIVAERFDGGDGTSINLTYVNTVVLWPILKCKLPSTTTAIFNVGDQVKAALIGPNVEVDYANVAATGGNTPWTAATLDSYLDVVHGTFRCINVPANNIGFDARTLGLGHFSKNRIFNTVWSVGVGAAFPSSPHLAPNQTPDGVSSAADSSITGGGRCNAYFKVGHANPNTVYGPDNYDASYLGFDAQTGSISLASEPSGTVAPVNGDATYGVANTANLPFAIQWWVSSDDVLRMMPQSPSIGSVQQSSAPLSSGIGGLIGAGILDDAA